MGSPPASPRSSGLALCVKTAIDPVGLILSFGALLLEFVVGFVFVFCEASAPCAASTDGVELLSATTAVSAAAATPIASAEEYSESRFAMLLLLVWLLLVAVPLASLLLVSLPPPPSSTLPLSQGWRKPIRVR